MTDHYAVIGHPISHSLSPVIHSAFAKQTKQDMDYIARDIEPDDLKNGLAQLQAAGFKGVNVTIPFKTQVWKLAHEQSERARYAGAVNTLVFQPDGRLWGDNTDGIGLCHDLTVNHLIELQHKRILLLGAGGAARGVIAPLLSHQPSVLHIANRTADKARQFCQIFADLGPVTASGLNDITGCYDVIINATAASLHGDVPPVPATILAPNSCCYDMMYGQEDTAFIIWAKQHGVQTALDGLGMLVEQAAASFALWRGIRPDTRPVIDSLRIRSSFDAI